MNTSDSTSAPTPGTPLSGRDAWDGMSAEGAEQEMEALRRNSAGLSLLGKILGHDERHLSLTELQALAQRHQQAQDAWELPWHLAVCPICLELFEALEDEGPPLSTAVRKRYRDLWPRMIRSEEGRRNNVFRFYPLLAIAAGLLIVAAGACVLMTGAGRASGTVLNGAGQLTAAAEAGLAPGAPIPARREIVTESGMTLVLTDGSQIAVAPQSCFHLTTPWLGQTTLRLRYGGVNLTVAKQPLGRTLAVQTPLGEILVVGTRFNVKTISGNALVFQQIAGNGAIRSFNEQIRSVLIEVSEGVVKVRNAHDAILVRAGYSAVLRGDPPRIELNSPAKESSP